MYPPRSVGWSALPRDLSVGLWIVSSPAHAESLLEALSATYGYNPRLDAERAFQRGTDEEVARAMSGYRPTVTGEADINWQREDQRPSSPFDGVTKPRGYTIQGIQPLFTGFRTYNAVNNAEATVRAERENLRDVERQVLLQAVTAYMDVVRDQELVRLNENNVNVLSRELKAAQDRFSVGEVTRTDVAQAEARRADAVSRLDAARANLRTSRGSFQQVVGHPPEGLSWPAPPERDIPNGLQDAIGISNNENPLVVAALYREQAAKYLVDQIRGELLPSVQLEASYTDRFQPATTIDELETENRDRSAHGADLRGGRCVCARAASQAEPHRRLAADRADPHRAAADARRCRGRSSRRRARRSKSDKVSVESNKVALQGVREEEKVGQRTLLDVLNAELEYFNSQVNLETDRATLVIAAYSVISAMGRLDVAWIGAAAFVYDPVVHYKEVRRKWIGVSITHADGRVEQLDTTPVEEAAPPLPPAK